MIKRRHNSIFIMHLFPHISEQAKILLRWFLQCLFIQDWCILQVICFFWIFGDNLEDKMGPIWLIIFYIISGISAGVAQFTFDPSSPIPDVGESGAIAGITGGYLLLFPKAKVDIFTFLIVLFKILPILAWVMLGLWFGLQLFSWLTIDTSGGGVAY